MNKKRLTINGLIDAAQLGSGITSDYGIAKKLGVARQNVGRWRRTNCIGDENIIALAELAGLDPAVIVAQIQEDRAQVDDVKRFWRDVQKRLKAGSVVASLMLAAALLGAGGYAPGHCILCKVSRARSAAVRRWRLEQKNLSLNKLKAIHPFCDVLPGRLLSQRGTMPARDRCPPTMPSVPLHHG